MQTHMFIVVRITFLLIYLASLFLSLSFSRSLDRLRVDLLDDGGDEILGSWKEGRKERRKKGR
jgi:hypothetical protein